MKILLVDDHALFREGAKLLLARLDPAAVLLETGSVEGALLLAESHDEFDLILLDLNLPGMRGRDGVRMIRRCYPASPLVVLSGVESDAAMRDSLEAGAQAFLPKSANGQEMLAVLEEVLAGGDGAPRAEPRPGGSAPDCLRSPWKLTQRQIDVMGLLCQGLSNKQIARSLDLSENTVRSHLAAIYGELGVRSRTQVAALAHRYGIV